MKQVFEEMKALFEENQSDVLVSLQVPNSQIYIFSHYSV